MKISNGTNSIVSIFFIFLLFILNSCSSKMNFDEKYTVLADGKFLFASSEVYLNGFVKILKQDNVFSLKIKTINSKKEYEVKFSKEKAFLSKKESKLFLNYSDSNLIDINFYKIFFWIFEPCNEIVCQRLNIGNLSIKRSPKTNSTLIEITNNKNLFTIKLIFR